MENSEQNAKKWMKDNSYLEEYITKDTVRMMVSYAGDCELNLKMEKQEFYTKLLAKLQKIKNGEMTLDFYINEVTEKLRMPHVVVLCARCKGSMYMAGYPGQKVTCTKCNGTGLNTVYKSVCECDIPYFPTGNIHWCSKCDRDTMY